MPQLSVSCRPNPRSSVVPATPQRYDATLGARGAYRDPQECAVQACRASFSQSRGRACARAKNAFLPFAEAPQGCQKSRQISLAAPGLSLSGRHPQGAASPAGGRLGYPADTTTGIFLSVFHVAVLMPQSDLYLSKMPISSIENVPAAPPRAIYLSVRPPRLLTAKMGAPRALNPKLRN